MDVVLKTLKVSELGRIEPLWNSLRLMHLALSSHFKEYFAQQTFERRCRKFRSLPEEYVHIAAAEDESGALVGYCICSVRDETGELDSIYVEPEYRGRGVGRNLAESGLAWLKQKGCRYIDVRGAEGNEAALPFYEKLGFCVRGTVLRLK
ncbi:MAG: GNAT family N-acetyltransferase [Christensenellaceae bacterium]|nr:GNAT family N-acetyltransferase [Christensenellaceae bacterium]